MPNLGDVKAIRKAKVEGAKKIAKRLREESHRITTGIARGLAKAGLFLQRESQKIVPIDTSALKNSAVTIVQGEGLSTVVIVGYFQSYALYVHEDLNARHAEGKSAKYLEKPLRQHKEYMAYLIRSEAMKR